MDQDKSQKVVLKKVTEQATTVHYIFAKLQGL